MDTRVMADCARVHRGRHGMDLQIPVGILWSDLGPRRFYGDSIRSRASASEVDHDLVRRGDTPSGSCRQNPTCTVWRMGLGVEHSARKGRREHLRMAPVRFVSADSLVRGDGDRLRIRGTHAAKGPADLDHTAGHGDDDRVCAAALDEFVWESAGFARRRDPGRLAYAGNTFKDPDFVL